MTVELQPLIVKANVIANTQIVKANVSTEIRPVIDVPEYEGEYTVTPTEETQTLETNGKILGDNVTVNSIPSEYIIPNGTVTLTSVGVFDISEYASSIVEVRDNYPRANGVNW